MLFSGDMFTKALDGTKTQTRRLAYPGDEVWGARLYTSIEIIKTKTGRTRFKVFGEHAVQPGRGKPTAFYHPEHPCFGIDVWKDATDQDRVIGAKQGYIPGRIRITKIRREDVRYITLQDAIAEGFDDRKGFWTKWCSIHDKRHVLWDNMEEEHIWDWLRTRPGDKYQAYPLNFERVIPEGYHVSL